MNIQQINEKETLLSDIYDYIIRVTIKQDGRLFPLNILYGDGTRWKKDIKAFTTVYNAIKKTLVDNNIKH